jgi:tRNA threonylcarbamoyladenosine biosynthesis protein TsaB
MKMLAVDTSSAICSVALLDDEMLIDEINLDNGRTHSENLMPLIDELLNTNNMKVKDIEFISCCVGPGSFTGIRIGVSSIKAIAEVLNIKLASVTSLDAPAANVNNSKTIATIIDARNNQVYCGIYDEEYNLKEEALADDINEAIKHI